MRKQKTPCTLSSYANLSEWQMSSAGSYNYENESLYSNTPWPDFITLDSNETPNGYQDIPPYDYCAAGDTPLENYYFQDTDYDETAADSNYVTYDYSWTPIESFSFPQQPVDESYVSSYALPVEDHSQFFAGEPFQQSVLQYGVPTVTTYGTVALLLRHLVRVDFMADGSVSVYNFPARSVATLNASGNKCYVKHPNGQIFQNGSVIHMMAGNDRLAKISRKGVTFSSALQSLAYFVDESGTKTTTSKFTDLSDDLTLDVFYDGNERTCEDLEQENLQMIAGSLYQNCPDGNELWELGSIRVMQDRWGQVTVTQKNNEATIITSPTIRRVTIESPSVSISIGCYSKSYFTVRKDNCLITSGFCGLIAQNQTQKAGLDRNGRLVLF